MIGSLFALPEAAKSALRLRGEALGALTAERKDEVKQWILEGAANPTLLLGTDPSPWNNSEITDGRHAQEALDLATRAAYKLWPDFERYFGQVVQQLGVWLSGTLDETATFLSLLCYLSRIRERYKADILGTPCELARALIGATEGPIARAWAFVSNGAYRAARKRLLALRSTPAAAVTLEGGGIERRGCPPQLARAWVRSPTFPS